VTKFSGWSGSTAIPGLFAIGSWLVGQFFPVPFNQGMFRAGAIFGVLAGYGLGKVWTRGSRSPNRGMVTTAILAALIVGVYTMVDYYFFVTGGHVVGFWRSLRAVFELVLVFACAGFLMPVAGIKFDRHERRNESEGAARPSDGNGSEEYEVRKWFNDFGFGSKE
jgi:hypothetical protein